MLLLSCSPIASILRLSKVQLQVIPAYFKTQQLNLEREGNALGAEFLNP